MEDFLKELMTKQILQMSIPIMFSAHELLLWISEKFSRSPNIRRVISYFISFHIGTPKYSNFDLGRFGRKTILIVEMLRTLASLFNEIFVSALFYTCTTYMEGELFSIKKHQIGSFVKCTTFFQQENVLNFAKTSINGKVRKNLEWFS